MFELKCRAKKSRIVVGQLTTQKHFRAAVFWSKLNHSENVGERLNSSQLSHLFFKWGKQHEHVSLHNEGQESSRRFFFFYFLDFGRKLIIFFAIFGNFQLISVVFVNDLRIYDMIDKAQSFRSCKRWLDSPYGQTQRISKKASFDKFFVSNPFAYFSSAMVNPRPSKLYNAALPQSLKYLKYLEQNRINF